MKLAETIFLLLFTIAVSIATQPCRASGRQQAPPIFAKEPVAQACQFENRRELLSYAQQVAYRFSSIRNFDPFFWETDQSKRIHEETRVAEDSRHIREQRQNQIAELSFAKNLFEVADSIANHPVLGSFKAAGFLGVSLDSRCDVACDQGAFVLINPKFATLAYENFPESFRDLMAFVIGHEIAHKVYAFDYWYSKGFASVDEYRKAYGNEEYRKLHLTVDAIGMSLAGLEAEEIPQLLEMATALSRKMSLPAGDNLRRIFCWRHLPD
jgi:hypothetical protein